jgi:hypothetical protein
MEKVQEFREIRRWRYTFRHISLSQTGSAGVPMGIFQKTNAGFAAMIHRRICPNEPHQ